MSRLEAFAEKVMDGRVISAHEFSINNEPMLRNDKKCGCFYCQRVFDPSELEEWIEDESLTALCPYCGIDAVIGESAGYPLTKDFLQAMYRYWF